MVLEVWHLDNDFGNSYPLTHFQIDSESSSANPMRIVHLAQFNCHAFVHLDSNEGTIVSKP